MATLDLLLATANGTVGPRDWDSQAFGDVDEGISGADGNFIARSTSTPGDVDADTSFQLTDVNSDFGNMDTLLFNISYRIDLNSSSDDTVGLEIRIMSGATVLAAAAAGGGFQEVLAPARTPTSFTTSGATLFDFVNGTATKAQWDAAEVEIRNQFTQFMSPDTNKPVMNVETFEFTGTYTVGGASANWDQARFRWRNFNEDVAANANGGGDWAKATDGQYTDAQIGYVIGIRFSLELTLAADTDGFKLFYQMNGTGGYNVVPDSALPYDPSQQGPEVGAIPGAYTDLADTTDLLGGTGSFVAGDHSDDNQVPSTAFSIDERTEYEFRVYPLKLGTDGHIADGEFIDFRMFRDDDTALDEYTVTPRLTFVNRPGHIGGTTIETGGQMFVVTAEKDIYMAVEMANTTPGNELRIMKSADGGTTWTAPDFAGAPTSGDIEAVDISYDEANDAIHIGFYQNQDVRYAKFYTSGHGSTPDEWDSLNELVSTMIGDQQVVALRHRGDGTVVCFYQDSDGSNERVRYRIRSTVPTWGSELTLDTEASTDIMGPTIAIDSADQIHIFYLAQVQVTSAELWHKRLSSGDSLSSRIQVDQGLTIEDSSNQNNLPFTVPKFWNDGGTDKIGLAYYDVNEDMYWNQSVITSSPGWGNQQRIGTSNAQRNPIGGKQICADTVIDDVDDEPWAFWSEDSDLDLMSNTDVSGWGTDVEERVGEIANIKAQTWTQSSGNGGDRVIGLLLQDNRGLGTGQGRHGFQEFIIVEVLAVGGAQTLTWDTATAETDAATDWSVIGAGAATLVWDTATAETDTPVDWVLTAAGAVTLTWDTATAEADTPTDWSVVVAGAATLVWDGITETDTPTDWSVIVAGAATLVWDTATAETDTPTDWIVAKAGGPAPQTLTWDTATVETDTATDWSVIVAGAATLVWDGASETDTPTDWSVVASGAVTLTWEGAAETDTPTDWSVVVAGAATLVWDGATETDTPADWIVAAAGVATLVWDTATAETDAATDWTVDLLSAQTLVWDGATETDTPIDWSVVVAGAATLVWDTTSEADAATDWIVAGAGAATLTWDAATVETDTPTDWIVVVAGAATLVWDGASETDTPTDWSVGGAGAATLVWDGGTEADTATDWSMFIGTAAPLTPTALISKEPEQSITSREPNATLVYRRPSVTITNRRP